MAAVLNFAVFVFISEGVRRKQNSYKVFTLQRNYFCNNSEFSSRIYAFVAKHEDLCFYRSSCCRRPLRGQISGWKSLLYKPVKFGRRTIVEAESLDLVPRWFEWRRLTVEILCDETGKWPEGSEVLKSRACSVAWPLWTCCADWIAASAVMEWTAFNNARVHYHDKLYYDHSLPSQVASGRRLLFL